MNIHLLDEKLKKIQQNLNEESIQLNQITQNLNEAKQKNDREEQYQKMNKEYKQLISQFSFAYLELCEWYVGHELPRPIHQTFLDSKEDINSLYFLFMMSLFLK